MGQDFIDTIIARVSEGETLNEVCADLRESGGPASSTFRSWIIDDKELGERYMRARALQWEHWADRIRLESSTPNICEKVKCGKDGVETTTGDNIDRSRLSVDSMKWLLSKLAPKKYGDKLQTEITGAEGGPLIISWQSQPKPDANG